MRPFRWVPAADGFARRSLALQNPRRRKDSGSIRQLSWYDLTRYNVTTQQKQRFAHSFRNYAARGEEFSLNR